MNCPACDSDNATVLDSRPIEDGQGIRRRRECRDCHTRFTSYEYLEGVLLRAFAADLRAVIERYEGGTLPNANRRIAPTIKYTSVGEVVPTLDVPLVHEGWAVPTMRERLRERRKDEAS